MIDFKALVEKQLRPEPTLGEQLLDIAKAFRAPAYVQPTVEKAAKPRPASGDTPRLPAGTKTQGSGKGRIHAGQWTKENNPATLAAAAASAPSYPHHVAIAHRQKQLAKKVAEVGLLEPDAEKATREALKEEKAKLTKAGLERAIVAEQSHEDRKARALREVLGSSWAMGAASRLAQKDPEVIESRKKWEKEKARQDKMRTKAQYMREEIRDWAEKQYTPHEENVLDVRDGVPHAQDYHIGWYSRGAAQLLEDARDANYGPATEQRLREMKFPEKTIREWKKRWSKVPEYDSLENRLLLRNLEQDYNRVSREAKIEILTKAGADDPGYYAPQPDPSTPMYQELLKEHMRFDGIRKADLQRRVNERYKNGLEYTQRIMRETADKRIGEYEKKLAEHEAALKRSKESVAAARKSQLVFEPQEVGGQAFLGELRRHPGQARAIFLEDTPFEDHIVYAEHSSRPEPKQVSVATYSNRSGSFDSKYQVGGYVEGAADNPKFRKALDVLQDKARKAVTKHDKNPTPENKKAADDALQLSLDYVDNIRLLNGKKIGANIPPIPCKGSKVTRADVERMLEKKTPVFFKHGKANGAVKEMVDDILAAVTSTDVATVYQPGPPTYRHFADVPEDRENEVIEALLGAGAKVTDNDAYLGGHRGSWAYQQGMDPGKRFTVDLGKGRKIHYVPHTTVGTKKVKEYTHTVTLGGWTPQKKAAAKRRMIARLRDGYGGTAESAEERFRSYGWDKILDALEKKEFTFTASTQDKGDVPMIHNKEFFDSVKAARLPKGLKDAIYAQGYDFQSNLLRQALFGIDGDFKNGAVTYKATTDQALEKVPHNAPRSERGVLRVDGMPPSEAMAALKRLKLTSGPAPEVPYQHIYRGSHRLGRVLPDHDDYTTGKEALKRPPGMVIHGVTAAQGETAAQVIEKLNGTGGLKAISERRRMGILAGGSSVAGDTGSGIDQYLFCKYGDSPSFGSGIYFLLKPEVLHRRDIAFAPKDYGGGQDRWTKYNGHAKRIGQGRFIDPPSHKARQRHFDSHASGNMNEVLLKHEVPWDDIDSIVLRVPENQLKEAQALVKRLKKKGDMPEDLEVIPIGGGHGGTWQSVVGERDRLARLRGV